MQRRNFLALTASALILAPTLSGRANARDEALMERLRAGGHVIYFRHGATTWSGIDSIDWPRDRQRLLSDLGIRQSEQIGRAFRDENIPLGEVLASPFARCRDMAEIAFGRVEERFELLGLLSDAEGREARVAYLTEKMTTAPAPGTNRVVIAHRSNIGQVAGVGLAEGEALVVEPTGDNFNAIAQLMPEDW